MFTKETYIRRRTELKKLVGEGVIVLFGNNDSPCNYPKYYLGYLEILELRQVAQKLWGSSFDDLSFHEFCLSHGPADFENLRKALKTTRNVK